VNRVSGGEGGEEEEEESGEHGLLLTTTFSLLRSALSVLRAACPFALSERSASSRQPNPRCQGGPNHKCVPRHYPPDFSEIPAKVYFLEKVYFFDTMLFSN